MSPFVVLGCCNKVIAQEENIYYMVESCLRRLHHGATNFQELSYPADFILVVGTHATMNSSERLMAE